MANRNFYPARGSLSREVVKLYGNVTIGGSGAVSAVSAKGFTVAKTGSETGRYTITLEDTYTAFRGAHVTVEGADDAALTAFYAAVRNVDVGSAKTLDIQLVSAIATDANPASGDVLHIELTLQNGTDV